MATAGNVAASIVSLERVADQQGLSVQPTVPEQIALRDQSLREWMAKVVIPAFLKANGWTLAALGALVVLDEFNVGFHLIAPGNRIITDKVIMALLGATTVQVGAIAYAIARYLFPGRQP